MPSAIWAPKAEQDLEEILYYIRVSSEHPLTAQRIGEEMVAIAERQSTLSESGARRLAAGTR